MTTKSLSRDHLLRDSSVEITGRDAPAIAEAAHLLEPGTRVNVTFLGQEHFTTRLDAAAAIVDAGFVPVPHIAARRLHSAAELDDVTGRLSRIGAAGCVFAVGGDPARPEGPYPDALSLITSGVLAQHGVEEVAIAGYPEGHPDISEDDLWSSLEAKVAAAEQQGMRASIITQFAFDADAVTDWIAQVRARGIECDVRVGTPGPAGIKRLLTFARRFGIGANAMIVKKYGFSLTNLLGTAGPDRFIDELATTLPSSEGDGRVKLHFYTFGGLVPTAQWLDSARANA